MTEYLAAWARAPRLVLGHGAGAGQGHPWMRRVAEGLAARGIDVVTFDFPYMAEGRKVPDRAPVLEAAWAAAWREAATTARGPMLAGGKSMGGRIASQAAARGLLVDPTPVALVFFGYPLHPPDKPAQRRDAHLPALTMPLLFLHGTRDPFGSPEEMTTLAASLPTARLHLVTGGDHSLVQPRRGATGATGLDDAMDEVARLAQGTGLGSGS